MSIYLGPGERTARRIQDSGGAVADRRHEEDAALGGRKHAGDHGETALALGSTRQ